MPPRPRSLLLEVHTARDEDDEQADLVLSSNSKNFSRVPSREASSDSLVSLQEADVHIFRRRRRTTSFSTSAAAHADERTSIKKDDASSKPRTTSSSDWLRYTQQLVPVTTSLPILVLIDMFAVSLVVPLLFQYYKAAGVTSANQRELLSSLFSMAQIVGGLLMGVLTDAGWVHRRTLLFLSFGGSALSYALIVFGGLPALILSRLLVGLVKQTMTVTTTVLTAATTKETRGKHMGRLTAASTVAWIVGPSAGALLFRYVDHRAPAVVAASLFAINLVLAAVFLKGDNVDDDDDDESVGSNHVRADVNASDEASAKQKQPSKHKGARASILSNFRSCFSSNVLGSVIAANLIVTWVTKATSYSQLGSFYEDMYGLEPHHRGYISSYQQALQFIVQSTLVDGVLKLSGGERRTTCFFTGMVCHCSPYGSPEIVATVCDCSLPYYIAVVCDDELVAADTGDPRCAQGSHLFRFGSTGCPSEYGLGLSPGFTGLCFSEYSRRMKKKRPWKAIQIRLPGLCQVLRTGSSLLLA